MIAKALLLLSLFVLAACAPLSLDADGWDHRGQECREQEDLTHPNGIWSQPVCRDGRGVLVWLVFTC